MALFALYAFFIDGPFFFQTLPSFFPVCRRALRHFFSLHARRGSDRRLGGKSAEHTNNAADRFPHATPPFGPIVSGGLLRDHVPLSDFLQKKHK